MLLGTFDFANGALTGTFSRLYNDDTNHRQAQEAQHNPDKNNPLNLTPKNAETTFGVFYPKSAILPSAEQIGPDGIALANDLIVDAAKIQQVTDIVQNFGPSSIVLLGLVTIIRCLGVGELKYLLTRSLTFEEKLGQFGGAARNTPALKHKTRFTELFGIDSYVN